jgi:type II secretory pathway component GspD/PulD (secretin)
LFNDTGPLGNSGSDQSLASGGRVGSQGISNFMVGRINNELGFGGLVLSASSESVSILVRALQESRRLQVLSRPQIMTLDNQGAFVQVGQQVPYITQSQLTTFGQINTVELIDTGLILGVTPRISPEGVVFMEIDAEQSKVGTELEGVPIAITNEGNIVRSPRIDIARAQTTVSAASGETIVLGGLITTREKDTHRRVPLLADIPLLGDLFRFDSVESLRAELLIILTPHVVLGPADTERIKQAEMARMSWCAADIHAMIDELGRCQDPNCPVCRSKVPVIYPDRNPRGVVEPGSPGILPREKLPTITPPVRGAVPHGEMIPPPPDSAGANKNTKSKSRWNWLGLARR